MPNVFFRLAARIDDPRDALNLIADYELRETERRFEAEEDPEGKPWQENAPSTLLKKRGPLILTESGDLRSEVTAVVERRQAMIGTQGRLPYEVVHQKGGVVGGGAFIPQRIYIGADERSAETYALLYLSYLRGLTGRTVNFRASIEE